MSNKPNYKTSRKFKCPYCDFKATRGELVDHVERKHEEFIPENYTAARVVYDSINGKNYGTCMICKCKVYEWNDKINRYYNLCKKAECKNKVRETALARHMKVYNKPTLLNDPEHQEKMLANRRISGTYTFSDGKKFVYTGKYERNALEFMDKVLEIPSSDILTPGPVLEYEYNGETHKWITDILYIPANLIIEIKDGGSNPNTRTMTSYREKQVAKEVMITDKGTYNYLRLTNNDFSQLLAIFADMKNGALNDDPKTRIHINEFNLNEEVGGLPPQRPPEAYIVPYGMNNVFDGYAYTDSDMDKMITVDDDGHMIPLIESEFYEKYSTGPVLYYRDPDIANKMEIIHDKINKAVELGKCELAEALAGISINKPEDLFISESFRYFDKNIEAQTLKMLENGVAMKINEDSDIVDTIGNVFIHISPNGYYATTPEDFYLATQYFEDRESLDASNIINVMNDVYSANSKTKGEIIDV